MSAYDWVTRPRDYSSELKESILDIEDATEDHPLLEEDVEDGGDEAVNDEAVDPLSLAADADPLSSAGGSSSTTKKVVVSVIADSVMDDSFEPWSMKRPEILSRYTTNEKLTINAGEGDGKAKVVSSSASASDKVKSRLEQLDDVDGGGLQEMLDLSQQEYITRIEELNAELTHAWENEQRVKALKIAIQCAKLLADTKVIQFYPSKFVLITDILDTFGKLVAERIYRKSAYYPPGSSVPKNLPPDFTPDMVPASAKETCRNWFFKIASIRELVPRLYVETAILRCYSFLTSGEYEQALIKLTSMMRGIGDPLVAIYARCYLCRVGVQVAPSVKTHLMANFHDTLKTYAQVEYDTVQAQITSERIEVGQYLHLWVPGLDWILQCAAYRAPDSTLDMIMSKSKEMANISLLLNAVMSAFPPEYISKRAVHFCELIRAASDDGLPKHHLYRTLGMNVSLSSPPKEQRLEILNDVWKIVMQLENPGDYVACAEAWIEYPVKNFTRKEVNAMLGDCIRHVLPDRAFENFLPQLQSMVFKIMSHMTDFGEVLSMSKFMPFIDLFQKEEIKLEVFKSILEAFAANQKTVTGDPVVVNGIMYIGKVVHDSVNFMTFVDEKKQICAMIIGCLSKVSFGMDFQATLNFLVEARSTFGNLDPVLVNLVYRVNELAMMTHKAVKGTHKRKTAGFVRTCVAYAFITTPSISNITKRLELYLVSAQVAIANQALTQGDACFKAAIKLIMEGSEDELMTASYLQGYMQAFMSSLLMVPDNPEQDPLYIFKGVLNVVEDFPWPDDSDAKACLFNSAIALLSAYAQEAYLYTAKGVEANDQLYLSNPKFITEVTDMIGIMIEKVMGILKVLHASPLRQWKLTMLLLEQIVIMADLTSVKLTVLITQFWKLSMRAGMSAPKQTMFRKLIQDLAERPEPVPGAAELLVKLV